MPYSDNLYSAWDDESDAEPIQDGLNQSELLAPETHVQHSQLGPDDGVHPGLSVSEAGDDAGWDGQDDNYDVLSPTDGYFGSTRNASTSSDTPVPVTATPSNIPRVPNIWVQDPSLAEGSTAESKAREADQERDASRNRPLAVHRNPTPRQLTSRDTYHQPSSSTHAPHGHSTTTFYTPYAPHRAAYDQRPLIQPREAPPAYTPSPTSSSPTSPPGSSDSSRNYSTFSPPVPAAPPTMRGQEEARRLLAGEPQSMADPEDGLDDASLPWRDRTRKRLSFLNRRNGKVILVSLILLVLSVGFLTAAFSAGRNTIVNRPVNPPPKEPSTKDPSPEDPPSDFNPPENSNPHMEYPELDNDFRWGEDRLCKGVQIARPAEKYDVTFAIDKKLVIVQDIGNETHGQSPNVQGTVIFRRTGSGTPGPSIIIDSVVNDDGIDISTNWDAGEQTLVVTMPRLVPWSEDSSRPCISIKITVWVPEDGSLDYLQVDNIHLGITLLNNLSISIAQRATLASTVGTITAASTGSVSREDSIIDIGAPDSFRFHSRFIEVKTTAATIKGSWPLYDYLGLQSVAGDIRVCVEPREANKEDPKPAYLYVKSFSGDVELREPTRSAEEAFALSRSLAQAQASYETVLRAETVLPPRDYRVDVQTTSGDIKAAAAFSSSCSIKSTSGDVRAALLPVLDSSLAEEGSKEVLLKTSSTSGTSDITVHDPFWVDSAEGAYVDLPAGPAGPADLGAPQPGEPEKKERHVPVGDPDNDASWSPWAVARDVASSSSSPQREMAIANARALRNLNGYHSSTSGSIHLKYPAVWEGEISLAATSGKLSVGGEGVKVIDKGGHVWPRKQLLARKGEEGGGKIWAQVMSGNVNVLVGKEDS